MSDYSEKYMTAKVLNKVITKNYYVYLLEKSKNKPKNTLK